MEVSKRPWTVGKTLHVDKEVYLEKRFFFTLFAEVCMIIEDFLKKGVQIYCMYLFYSPGYQG